jgi:tetratricopeptide (TPR) repeat protein
MIVRALPVKEILRTSLLASGLIALAGLPLGCSEEAVPPETTSTPDRIDYDPVRFEEGLLAVETWIQDGRPGEAEQIARRLVTLNPTSLNALEAHARCLSILAAMAAREGRTDGAAQRAQALQRYRALIEHSGSRPTAMHLHAAGLAAQSAGELEEALDYHVRADEIEPTNAQHAIFAGNIHAGRDETEAAKTWFSRATTINPREPWGWAGLAEAHRQSGATDEALVSIRSARSRSPKNNGFRVAEARILRESGRGREAAQLLFAIDLDQRATPAITAELCAACSLIGEHRLAADAWSALHARSPDDHMAATNAALAWIQAGEPAEAATWLEAAAAAGADPEELESIRRDLSHPTQPR